MKHWSDSKYTDGCFYASAILSGLMFVGAVMIFLA